MNKPRIIVTGASGKTGNIAITELLKAGYPVPALVRREDGRSARLQAQGTEMAVADVSDVERVADVLDGVAPLSPGFNLDRYDRELRRPFPSSPQFATDSKVWRREHAIADNFCPPMPVHGKAPIAATSRGQSLEF